MGMKVERATVSSVSSLSHLHKMRKKPDRVLELPGNTKCADCDAAPCTWCSTKVGTVICINCAGCHRSLGTHITLVKSLKLDRWSEAEVGVVLELGGNEKLNAEVFEQFPLEAFPRPTRSTGMEYREEFIRAKYVEKLFASEDRDDSREPVAATDVPLLEVSSGAGPASDALVGLLQIKLVGASNLVDMDIIGKSDPYVRFRIGSLSDAKIPSSAEYLRGVYEDIDGGDAEDFGRSKKSSRRIQKETRKKKHPPEEFVALRGQEAVSSIKLNTLDPIWNETLMLSSTSFERNVVVVEVFDWDRFKKDDKCGWALIKLEEVQSAWGEEVQYVLLGVKHGSIRLVFNKTDLS